MPELLPWQRRQWNLLMQRRSAGRLPHALLCSGAAGLGKRQFAERLAQTLLCQAPASDGSPCTRCRSCQLVQAGSHPDYSRVGPAADSKLIKVDQVRELCAFLGYTSRLGGYKIALLTPAEQMNPAAANSLLKTLEEPPSDSLLLLVTTAPSRLPATVRSRCQPLVFQPPPAEQALAWLAPQLGGDRITAGLLLSLNQQAPLAALAAAGGDRLARRQALFEDYCTVLDGRGDPLRAATAWQQGDVAENLRWLLGWHSDLLKLRLSTHPPRLLNPDLVAPLRRLAARWPAPILWQRLDAVGRLYHLATTTQVKAETLLESFFSDLAAG